MQRIPPLILPNWGASCGRNLTLFDLCIINVYGSLLWMILVHHWAFLMDAETRCNHPLLTFSNRFTSTLCILTRQTLQGTCFPKIISSPSENAPMSLHLRVCVCVLFWFLNSSFVYLQFPLTVTYVSWFSAKLVRRRILPQTLHAPIFFRMPYYLF